MSERRPRFLWLIGLLVPVLAFDVWLHVREKPDVAAAPQKEAVREESPPTERPEAIAIRPPDAPPAPPPSSRPSPKMPVPVQAQHAPPPMVLEERSANADEPPVVTLAQVGDIALGVRQDPRLLEIRDEARLKQVLERVGYALQERVRQHPEEGSAELVERLTDYREELDRYMSGDVQIRGPGWTIETETGPALPREKWWTPRP